MSNKKRKKYLTDKAQIEAAGIDLDGESLSLFTTNMTGLADYMRDIDSQQFISRYKWKGLPKNIYGWRVEQMLYFRASLALFKIGKDFMMLPYASTRGYNAVGIPNAVKPVSFNGEYPEKKGETLDYELFINNVGVENPNVKAVLLFDRFNGFGTTSKMSRYQLSAPIIEEICNRFAFLGINIKNSQGKYIIICKDENTAQILKNSLDDMYSSTRNYQLVRSMFEVQVINNKVDYQEQQIWEDISSWDSLRLNGMGYENNGMFNKKERKLDGELSGGKIQTCAVLMNGLRARKWFCEQVKEIFANDPDFDFSGLDVELNEEFQEKEEEQINENIDVKNDTQEDENNVND